MDKEMKNNIIRTILEQSGITDEDFTNPSKKSFEALRKYAIDYNLINDNPKGRK